MQAARLVKEEEEKFSEVSEDKTTNSIPKTEASVEKIGDNVLDFENDNAWGDSWEADFLDFDDDNNIDDDDRYVPLQHAKNIVV